MDPALQTFVAESRELLREMEEALLGCEQGAADSETINAIFRVAHTLKGSSGLFGLERIVAFTHVMESVLDRVRAGQIAFDARLAGILLECRDHVLAQIDSVAALGTAEEPHLVHAGAQVLQKLADYDAPTSPATTPAAAAEQPQAQPQEQAACEWDIEVRFGQEVLRNGMDPLSFLRYLTTFGEIVSIRVLEQELIAADPFDPECCYLGFELTLATAAGRERIEAAFEFVREDCSLRIKPRAGGEHGFGPAQEGVAQESAAGPARSGGEQRPSGEAFRPRKGAEAQSIRVDGEKLDRLIDLIGELVIAGAATNLTARRAGLVELHESTLRLERLVEEIRDQALQLRMVPIGATFARFQRIVRDVARETGKAIRLEVSGADTELDKTLIERIADPLTHLVRNAIDHGIEHPDLRRTRGKPPEGIVRLNAYHESGSVVIEVGDDGNGLSRERIVSKALERGLISDATALSDAQVHALIFEPGFSTAEQITNLSGRGVGMDVVKRNVSALRGTVEVDSREGAGSIVRIRLPLTLAIIDGFLVGVGRSSFVIPLDMVEECVELTQDERTAAAGHRYINLRGTVLPFIRLRDLLGIPGVDVKRESIVVVRCGSRCAGIVVDELLGELQAVIKPLSRIFSRLQGISGSTILGSGEVALILDVGGLVERCLDDAGESPMLARQEALTI